MDDHPAGLPLDHLAGPGRLVEPPPPTLTAEYMGGTWSISPTKAGSAAATRSAVSPVGSPRAISLPSPSSVSVATPKATSAS